MAKIIKAIPRHELYALVWQEPRTQLAKQFGVSDVTIGKACKHAGIPTPGPGYWAKQRAGKDPKPPPLPPREPGIADEITFGQSHYERSLRVTNEELRTLIPTAPSFPEPIEDVLERIRPRLGKVTVPKSLIRPHKAIAQLLKDDDARREKLPGLIFAFESDKPRFDSPIQKRRLRILSGIFSTLARFGVKAYLDRQSGKDISLTVGDQNVSVKLEPFPHKSKTERDQKSTALALTVGGRSRRPDTSPGKSWTDEGETRLESHITEICEQILLTGERQYRENEIHHYNWLLKRKEELEEAERQRQETEARLERERLEREAQERIQKLLEDASAHRQANEIRDYISRVTDAVNSGAVTASSKELERWKQWAHNQADALDPLTSGHFVIHDE